MVVHVHGSPAEGRGPNAEGRGPNAEGRDVSLHPSLIPALAALCREHPTAEKIVVVPSLAVGHQLGDRLARLTPWINLRFETIRTLVDGVVGLDIATEGLTILSRAQSLALVEQACRETLAPDSYFGAIAGRPGLHRAIQRTLDDLRHAAVSPATYRDRFEDPRKGEELQAILDHYEAALEANDFIDRSAALRRASEKLTTDPLPDRTAAWAVLDLVDLSPAEERFLQRLARDRLRVLTTTHAPDNLAAARFFTGVGEDNEVREVFRRVLGEGVPFDDVEIIYATADPYLSIVHDIADELAIPCTFADGRPARLTRPGQAALGFLRWVACDFEAVRLRRLCLSGAIHLREDDGLYASQLANLLLKAGIGWRRDRYTPCLAAFRARVESGLGDDEEEPDVEWKRRLASQATLAGDLIRRWLDLVPLPDVGGSITLGALALGTRRFVEGWSHTRSEEGGTARKAIVRMLDELTQLPEVRDTLQGACARLEKAITDLLVGVTNPRPGEVHVSALRAGGYSGRRHVFFLGLDDSRIPGAGLQDPILLDSERGAVNALIDPAKLPLLGDAPKKSIEQFHRTVALASGDDVALTFSWPSHDLLERRVRFPAAVALELFRAARGDGALQYKQLVAHAEEAKGSFVPSQTPLDLSEWWLMQVREAGRDAVREALCGEHPGLAAGREAELARLSDQLTPWDGFVEQLGGALDPRTSGRVMSASQLEKLAACPYGWFLQRALGITPLEEAMRDAAEWLSAMDKGSLVHEVLERFIRRVVERGETVDAGRHVDELSGIAEDVLLEWKEKVPPGSDAAFGRCRDDVLRGCTIFLSTDTRPGVVPWGAEVAFGFGPDNATDRGLAEPVAIPLGGGRTLLLRGKIDRIDRVEDTNQFEIWDYKSGSKYKYKEASDILRRGTLVQHGLYRLAAEQILRANGIDAPEIIRSGYYFPSEGGSGERIDKIVTDDDLITTLNHVCDLLADGILPHAAKDECTFCDFAEICGGADLKAEEFERKTEGLTNRGIQAWRALQEVK